MSHYPAQQGMFVIQHGAAIILCSAAAAVRLRALHGDRHMLKQRLRPSRARLRGFLLHEHGARQRLRVAWQQLALPGRGFVMSDGMMISTVLDAVEKGSLFAIYAAARPVVTSPQVDVAMLRGRLATAEVMLRSQLESAGEDVAGWSAKAKMSAMLRQMPDYLTGDALVAFESLISDEGLEFLIGSTLVLAAAQEFGIGELADAGLVAWAWWNAGRAGLNALADVLRAFVMVLKAQNDPDIRRAAALCAGALVVLGISALTLLIARASRRKCGGESEVSGGQSELEAPVVSRRGIARNTVEADAKQAAAEQAFNEQAPNEQAPRRDETSASAKQTTRADLIDGGNAPDRGGLTKAGRALAKHGGREGSSFSNPTGNPDQINQQGQVVLEEIVDNPQTIERSNRFGGIDYIAPDGRGARFGPDGQMMGLLEP